MMRWWWGFLWLVANLDEDPGPVFVGLVGVVAAGVVAVGAVPAVLLTVVVGEVELRVVAVVVLAGGSVASVVVDDALAACLGLDVAVAPRATTAASDHPAGAQIVRLIARIDRHRRLEAERGPTRRCIARESGGDG